MVITVQRVAKTGCLIICLALLQGCQSVSYYSQAIKGQWQLVADKEDIQQILEKSTTEPELKRRLQYVLDARRFASDTLGLPDNDSYTEYVDLGRDYAVWNVMATGEFSLKPKQWCFFIVGCLSYKGFFDKADAEKLASTLNDEGYDTATGSVAAYSTLGWFNDPVLNTIIRRPPYKVAGLIFHELAHQAVYTDSDTQFNESFATTVELEGLQLWLRHKGVEAEINNARLAFEYKTQFKELLFNTRQQLLTLYKQEIPPNDMRKQKALLFKQLKDEYVKLKQEQWDNYSGYDGFFDRSLNNAHLISVSLYHGKVQEFARIYRLFNDDMPLFIRFVQQLAKSPQNHREQVLTAPEPFVADFIKNLPSS